VLFNTLGAPLASTQGPTCTSNCGTQSVPQIAGLVSIQDSAVLKANLPGGLTCPSWDTANNCRNVSFPLLANDVIWKNRSFHIGVGALGAGSLNQQNVVTLLNAFTNGTVTSQPTTDAATTNGAGQIITGGTGACVSGVSYWDLGVRGDTGPGNHS